jgi:ABC-2 type transport system ATP-binding protein
MGIPTDPVDDYLIVNLPADRTPRAIWEAAHSAGEQVRAFRPRRSTLEEVFLDALGGKA